jgi:hypothetical protein
MIDLLMTNGTSDIKPATVPKTPAKPSRSIRFRFFDR